MRVRNRRIGCRLGVLLALFLALVGWTGPSAVQARAQDQPVTIYVHYDTGFGNDLSIRGDTAPLNWDTGQPMTWTTGNVWVWQAPAGLDSFQFKVLFNDSTWSTGGNYQVTAATPRSLDIYPFFGPSQGSLVTIPDFYSPQLDNSRDITLYLPPSYDENTAKRYPVLYMHDGQNLFDPATATNGVEWQVDESFDRLIGQGAVREAIVVGIDNTPDRISEYTPTVDPTYGGGNADAYLDFIQQTLKPYVDAHYRTLTDAPDTMMMGSSLGGLLSCYAGLTRSTVYGAVGCMSSSFWWDDESFTHTVQAYQGKKPVRIYLDAGGVDDGQAQTETFRDALLADGWVSGDDMLYVFDPDGAHNEASWAARLPTALEFLLPASGEIRPH
jgi:predicted alpha/beta superfamily hydrolase